MGGYQEQRLNTYFLNSTCRWKDQTKLMVISFVIMNSVMKRYNLKRGEISEVTESCNFKRFVGDACG